MSDKYKTLITPADFTFSIWSVIYLLLIVSLVYWFLKRKDARVGEKFAGISLPFWLSCIWNILWIVFFSYEKIGLSVIFIGLLLLTLLFILGTTPRDGEKGSLLLSITFGLYGGWLFVATFVNVGAYVEAISFEKFGLTNELFYSILVVLLLLTAFIVQKIHKNRFFFMPTAWAFFGVFEELGSFKTYPLLRSIVLLG